MIYQEGAAHKLKPYPTQNLGIPRQGVLPYDTLELRLQSLTVFSDSLLLINHLNHYAPPTKALPATGPTNPEPSTSTLQSISDQCHLSEQPKDLQSIHTPDDNPEPIDKGKGQEDPPPGNNELDDDPDDDPQDDDEEDGKKFFKKLLLALDKPSSEPP